MEDTETKPDLEDVKKTIVKIMSLNDLFFNSIMFDNEGLYCMYKYVAKEMGNYISVLIKYYDIDY